MRRALADLMRVEIADDQMSAMLVLEPDGEPGPLDAPFAESLLTAREIPLTRERSALVRQLLERYAAQPDQPHRLQIASGMEPVHGTSSHLELASDCDHKLETSQTPRDAHPDSSAARVDPHTRTRFHPVKAGQAVGKLHPPKPGTDGVDVFGRVVRAKSPKMPPITIEDSIAVANDGTLIAKLAGLVEFSNRRLKVSDTLTLHSAVDFSTGNIEFPGHVVVDRGVRDDFVLHAGGDLRIGDLVEAAEVHAGRDLQLEIGMSGRGKGTLRVGRDLRTKYLAEVKAVVVRDAHIQKDISNCELRVGRHLRASACTLMRGELWVGLTCQLAHAGTDAHVPTAIVLGKFESLELAARQALQLAPEVLSQHERSRNALSTLQRATGKLTPRQAEEVTELQFQCAKDETTLRQLERGIRTISQQMEKFAKAELVVNGIIYPGVRVWVGGYCIDFHEPIRGPIRIALDEHGGPFCVDISINEKHQLAKFARVRADPRFLDIEQEARNLGLGIHAVPKKAA